MRPTPWMHMFAPGLLLLMAASTAQALDWSDNVIGYRYGTRFAEPAHPATIRKSILSFSHASGYHQGKQLFMIDMLLSDGRDPKDGSSRGAREFYAFYRHKLSLSAISGRDLGFGPVRDVQLAFGGDWGHKNDPFSSRPRKLRIGPSLSLDVPGFLDAGVYVQKEWNYNGIVHRGVNFRPAPLLAAAWSLHANPGIPLQLNGFLNYIGVKGRDGFDRPTSPELLFRAALMFDAGSLPGHAGHLWAGPGYEFWNNKFGNAKGTGTRASTPMLMLDWHL